MEHRIQHQQCLICKSSSIRKVFPIKDHSITQADFEIYECQQCQFRFTQGIPVADDLAKYYQSEDYISHSDTTKGLINKLYHWARAIMLQRKYRLVKQYASKNSLLDIGSGTGYFLNYMSGKSFDVKGVEADPGARKYTADQFGIEVDSPIDFLGKSVADTYGIVTMWHVLEHVYNPDEYLENIHLQLDAKGAALIAVPNYTSFDGNYYQEIWAGYDVPRHFWHFTPENMETIAQRNGFRVDKKIRMPLDPFYVALLSEKYKGTGAIGMIKAGWIGLRSHLKSLSNVDRSSSIIYVLKKVNQ